MKRLIALFMLLCTTLILQSVHMLKGMIAKETKQNPLIILSKIRLKLNTKEMLRYHRS